jgi:hypothetical protein
MKNNTKTVTLVIDGEEVEFVRADSIKTQPIEYTGEGTSSSLMIGKKVIARTRNEGINAGIVKYADKNGVILSSARRIWYHKPADKSLCWYEGVAESGLSKDSKVSCTVGEKAIIEDYSLTICTDEAFSSIMEKTPHAQ